MPVLTAKILASLLQFHGPDATIQSDHQGIGAVLGSMRERIAAEEVIAKATDVSFRRGGFRRGFTKAGGP